MIEKLMKMLLVVVYLRQASLVDASSTVRQWLRIPSGLMAQVEHRELI